MADSVGGGIARGLESGWRMVMGQRQQEEAERARRAQEDRQEREFNALQDQRAFERQRQEAADARIRESDAWNAVEVQRKDLNGQLTGLLSRYGYDPAKAQADPAYAELAGKVADVKTRRQLLIDQKWKPFLDKQKADADEYVAGLSNGSIDPTKDGARFVRAVTTITGRPIKDFMRDGDAPSAIERDVQGAMSGIESKNTNAILDNLNRLMGPSLRVGVGHDAPEEIAGPNATITGKEIVAVVPAPDDPNKFYPVLKVHVRRGNEVGSYIAPVTQSRSTHGDDAPIPPIEMQKAFDYFGRMGALAQIANTPQMRAVIEQGMKDAGSDPDDILSAIYATGGTFADTQRKVKRERVNLGGVERERTVDSTTGQIVDERDLPRSAPPRMFAPPRPGGLQSTLDAIDSDPDLTDDERADLRKQALQSAAATGGRGSRISGLNGGGSISATELKQAGDIGERAAADKIGIVLTKGGYVDAKSGAPANPEQLAALSRARLASEELVRNNAANRQRTSGTDVVGAATASIKTPQGDFKVGQVYTNAKGQRAKFGGTDGNGNPVWLKP